VTTPKFATASTQPITQASLTTIVLRRGSRLGVQATLVFTARDKTVTFASAMTYTSRFERMIWAAVAPTHRWAVRYVLTHAAKDFAQNLTGR
jgi:hypothetical protein